MLMRVMRHLVIANFSARKCAGASSSSTRCVRRSHRHRQRLRRQLCAPLHALAEYLGDRVMPALEAAKEEQKKMKREAKLAGREVPLPELPYIPPLLPVTRWASNDPQFRSTLVVEEGAQKKARLSWYHPDDTMVPREWFSRGLLDDLRYFNPFGLGSWMAKEATK